jgi:MFS transporter, OFA family, oxalate/formate antiporter
MYSSVLAAGWSHLPARIGTVTGIVISGFGFGGFFFGIVTSELCNPDNLPV